MAVISVARPNRTSPFACRRAYRMKMFVHGDFGVGLVARRLNSVEFAWLGDGSGTSTLRRPQLDELDPEQSRWVTWRTPDVNSVNFGPTTTASSLNKR